MQAEQPPEHHNPLNYAPCHGAIQLKKNLPATSSGYSQICLPFTKSSICTLTNASYSLSGINIRIYCSFVTHLISFWPCMDSTFSQPESSLAQQSAVLGCVAEWQIVSSTALKCSPQRSIDHHAWYINKITTENVIFFLYSRRVGSFASFFAASSDFTAQPYAHDLHPIFTQPCTPDLHRRIGSFASFLAASSDFMAQPYAPDLHPIFTQPYAPYLHPIFTFAVGLSNVYGSSLHPCRLNHRISATLTSKNVTSLEHALFYSSLPSLIWLLGERAIPVP